MAFNIDASSIAFKETRRGINATAVIISSDGERVGKIHDVAERSSLTSVLQVHRTNASPARSGSGF